MLHVHLILVCDLVVHKSRFMVENLRDWGRHILDIVFGPVVIGHSSSKKMFSFLILEYRIHVLLL